MDQQDVASQLLALFNSPEYQAQMQELKDRSKAAVDLQRQGVQENEAAIQEMAQRGPETNWAPGIATADMLFNTNFSKTYNQPQSKDARDKEIMVLKNYLQSQKKGLSDAEIDLLKSQMQQMSLPLQLSKGQGTQGRFDTKLGKDIDDVVRKEFANSSKDLEDLAKQYKNLEASLSSGDSVKVNASLSNFARLIAGEKGVLTDQDIARAMPSTLINRINTLSTYFGDPKKEAPAEVVDEMLELVSQAKSLLKDAYTNKVNATRDSLEAIPTYSGAPAISNLYKINMDKINKNLTPGPTKMKRKVAEKKKDPIDEEIERLTKELEQ